MFKVQAIFCYNSEHHTTRRNDLAAAESHFCQFLENDAPGSSKFEFKIPVFECFFQKFSTFQSHRIVGNGSKMSRERALDAPDLDLFSAR